MGKAEERGGGKGHLPVQKDAGIPEGADGQPEIVPEEAEIIRRIYHRYLDGCTLGQIKRELEKDGVPTAQGVERWSPSIIHNILTNEKYIGDALLQKTYVTDCINKKVKKNRGERTMYYVENSHPAIVSRDLFNQVQQEMTRRSSKRKVLQKSGKTELGKYSGKYALTELLVCGECGSPYKRVTWARNGKKRIVWRCVSRLEFGTKYCQHSPTLDEGKLHSAILAAMNEYAAIRQEVCPDVLAMAEEARQALSQAGARLLQLKKRMDAVSREQSDVLDRLLVNMADTELNASRANKNNVCLFFLTFLVSFLIPLKNSLFTFARAGRFILFYLPLPLLSFLCRNAYRQGCVFLLRLYRVWLPLHGQRTARPAPPSR